MDDRDDPETNVVVNLRRKGDPSEEERKELARKIYASEDDVGTYSHGNLVEPQHANSRSDDDKPEEQTGRPTSAGHAPAGKDFGSFFEELGGQTPAQMAESSTPKLPAHVPAGSAQLPAELVDPRRHGRRRLVAQRLRPSLPRERLRSPRQRWGALAGITMALVAVGAYAVLADKGAPLKRANGVAAVARPVRLQPSTQVRHQARRRLSQPRKPRPRHAHPPTKTIETAYTPVSSGAPVASSSQPTAQSSGNTGGGGGGGGSASSGQSAGPTGPRSLISPGKCSC